MLFHSLSLLTVLLPQAGDELLGGDDPHLLLLGGDAVEEVGQAGEQVLPLLLLGLVGQDVLPERPARIQGLQHRVAVACVPELEESGTEPGEGVSIDHRVRRNEEKE